MDETQIAQSGPKRPMRSIRHKVLGLVVLAAVLPTALVGTSSYWTARATLTDKLSEQLNSRASLAAARVAEWYQERRNDARVFAGSSVVIRRFDGQRERPEQTRFYLDEVKGRYGYYRTLAVLDRTNEIVASVGTSSSEDIAAAVAGRSVRADATITWDADHPLLWVTSPILADDGRLLGRFVMACDFESLREVVAENRAAERIRLSADSGRVLFAHPAGVHESGEFPEELSVTGGITELRDARGAAVLAAARVVTIPELDRPLTLTVTIDAKDAFASVTQLRERIVVLSAFVVLLVVALGYGLVSSLADPLEALAIRARAVAQGDYASDLPVRNRDEIGYLTEVFNAMTANLKASHERLERLSVTDELTQLVNRRALRRVLDREVASAQHTGSPLSLILLDIDHFKAFNDELGHLRGDELLTRLGSYLRSELASDAVAARYGGEEFLVLLPGRTVEQAAEVAERLRTGFNASAKPHDVTLSLGVAAFGDGVETTAKLIDAADRALYRAKRGGRNRVVVARESGEPSATKSVKPKPRPKKSRSPRKSKTSDAPVS